ncbi:hypothetical protein EIN_179150 [Entamoeba invadens IP1]|uniref:hypothetical protein n=1 Tax=Entamoeba invadens IP1 TaxID=370355 RepID=UPI0002C3F987|nr:hypothetical protein EIN_179150 [Entamoeba invadens IP1]ELP93928.1 hypothetical protein EIN_179150 [Entamoeba invadens IP1]|eukprot:XP_004260699.1 hypothetical protein EIN_179150 [Entamoeba invadens IP1]
MSKLDSYSLLIVAKYFLYRCDFINVICVCKKFKETLEKFHYNPIPITSQTLFPRIETQYLYSKNDRHIPFVDLFAYDYPLTYTEYLDKQKQIPKPKCYKVSLTASELNTFKTLPKEVSIITKNCFENSQFDTFVLPSQVNKIEPSAFRSCLNMTQFTFSDIKSLPLLCFESCTKLKNFVISSSVTSIGSGCFFNCMSLTSIVIPENVEEIGFQLFGYCEGLKSVVIRSPVKNVPFALCKDCSALTKVVLNDDITLFGEKAFMNCTSLKSLKIPSKLNCLNGECFRGCVSLESLLLPSAMMNISTNSFWGCSNLTSLNFPTNNFGEFCCELSYSEYTTLKCNIPKCIKMFYNFEEKDVDDTNSMNGETSFKSDRLSIPTVCNRVGNGCYQANAYLKNIVLRDGIETIGEKAFASCPHLKNIYLATSLTRISSNAFENNIFLTSMTIPSSVIEIEKCVFKDCVGLLYVEMRGVSNIRQNAFCNCVKLETIIAPRLQNVRKNAVLLCDKLTSLQCNEEANIQATYFENRIYKKLGNYVNQVVMTKKCVSNIIKDKQEFEVPQDVTCELWRKSMSGVKSKKLVIPSNVTRIRSHAFYNNTTLESLTIFSTVRKIGREAFMKCKHLRSIVFENGNDIVFSRNVFIDCFNIEEIKGLTCYNGAVSVQEEQMFHQFKIACPVIDYISSDFEMYPVPPPNLKTLSFVAPNHAKIYVMPRSVTKLHRSAFQKNEILEKVVLSRNLSTFEKTSFTECKALLGIAIPSNVSKIPKFCFNFCFSMKHIEIPNTVVTIGKFAFNSCSELKDVVIGNSVTTIGEGVFYSCFSLTRIILPQNIKELPMLSFFSCLNLKEINLPNGITRICSEAFLECYSLSQVNIPDTVKVLERNCFKRCYSLDSIDLNNVEIIETMCFSCCRGLCHVKIPQTVTQIGYGAFLDCINVESVKVESSVFLMLGIFEGCEKLKNISIEEKGVIQLSHTMCQNIQHFTVEKSINRCTHNENVCIYETGKLIDVLTRKDIEDNISASYTVPPEIDEIGEFCFSGFDLLKTVQVGRNVKRIQKRAFYDCPKLESIIDIKMFTIEDIIEKCPSFESRSLFSIIRNSVLKMREYS